MEMQSVGQPPSTAQLGIAVGTSGCYSLSLSSKFPPIVNWVSMISSAKEKQKVFISGTSSRCFPSPRSVPVLAFFLFFFFFCPIVHFSRCSYLTISCQTEQNRETGSNCWFCLVLQVMGSCNEIKENLVWLVCYLLIRIKWDQIIGYTHIQVYAYVPMCVYGTGGCCTATFCRAIKRCSFWIILHVAKQPRQG